jgi:SOS-response transcriptional repressor LexA
MSRNFLKKFIIPLVFMNWIKIIEIAEETITRQGIGKAKLPEILGVNPQYLTDIRTKKKKSPGPEFALSLITKLNFNPSWLETGEGMIFSPPPPEKHPLVLDLEAIIEQKLGNLESRIADLESQIKEMPSKTLESNLFVSEPEPKYDEDQEKVTFVENIAAGRPVFQSEAWPAILVPGRYIKTMPEDHYVGRIKGASMSAAGIPDGRRALFAYRTRPGMAQSK